MKKIFLFIFTFILASQSLVFACKNIRGPEGVNVAIDVDEKKHFFYNDIRMLFDRPLISLNECKEGAQADKYLMFAIGLENYILSDEFLTYSFNDNMSGVGEGCNLLNSRLKVVQTPDDRRKRLKRSRKFLNQCLKFQVTDFSNGGLEFPEKQPGCEIEKISNNAANFKGSFCFFKPKLDSSFILSVDIDPNCVDKKFFSQNNIELQDILGLVSLYLSGDSSGNSPDLTSLKQIEFRASVNPLKGIIPASHDYGESRPTWPTTWNSSELYFGKPKLNTNASMTDELRFPILASNICPKKCVNDICTSSCNYSQPIVGEFDLYEINGKKKELLYSWFDGGIAPQNWQGFLQGIGVTLPKGYVQAGREYIVTADFSDQELNYLHFKGRIDKQISFLYNHIQELNRGGRRIHRIHNLGKVTSISKLPQIGSIDGIYFSGNGFTGVDDALGSVKHVFKSSYWPPYFNKVCHGIKCLNQSAHENKIALKFKISKDGKKHIVEAPVFQRKSNLLGNLKLNNYIFPSLSCGLLDDDEDDDFDDDLGDFDF